MTKRIEEKLDKIPILNLLVKFLKKIKLPGFKGLSIYDLFEMYFIGIIQGALTTRASAIAFSFFMALFPFLLFVLIIIPHIPIDGFETDFLLFLESFLPPTTSEFFSENIFDNINGGSLISTVFLLSIFLMANGVNAVFSGFENSYHQQLTRTGFKQYIYALSVAIILALLLIFTVAGLGAFQIYVIQPLFESLENKGITEIGSEVFWALFTKYLFFIIMIYLATSTLYYFGTKEGRVSKFFSVGALFTTILIIVSSYLFGIYIENFGQFNKLYGSIGALLILMFYLWLNANILLLGFELNITLRFLRKGHYIKED
jgi:membrane protein